MKRVSFVIVAITAVSVAAVADSADWLRFRGSQGLGTSSETNLPAEWSSGGGGKNVAWKAPLPGPGSSSPIVAGGRIYLTCYQVLHAVHDERAAALLTMGYTILQERAAKITSEALRRSYLHIAVHAEVCRLYEADKTNRN